MNTRALPPSRAVPPERIVAAREGPFRANGAYVLYWMQAFRRTAWNFALDRAVELARRFRLPLLVLETSVTSGRWATDRQLAFILDGMADNAQRCGVKGVGYYPYLGATTDCGELAAKLAASAAAVVTDDYPLREPQQAIDHLAKNADVVVEKVDGNGLLPMRLAASAYPSAYTFRRFLQKQLPEHLPLLPAADALAGRRLPPFPDMPRGIRKRWPAVAAHQPIAGSVNLGSYSADHAIPPASIRGGRIAGRRRLEAFVQQQLSRYHLDRNHPDLDASSGLSPYLHHGHISAAEIFCEVAAHCGWSPDQVGEKITGRAQDWWGMPEPAEAFVDELITWRELGFNCCAFRPDDYDRYESLPGWAQKTLAAHASDPREVVYSVSALAESQTHDPLWNAAQRQLVDEGRLHNYLRMLWGKKILQWTSDPQQALEVMIQLNNRYALDAEDPNSYTGIFWVLGRYDRPWAPQRPVFGQIRYMSSENTRRKVRVREYLERYSPQGR